MKEMNMTKMSIDWNIDSIVSTLSTSRTNQEHLKQTLTDAMMKAMQHELIFKSRARVSRFVRSTKNSDIIGHNYLIMRSMQTALENCKKKLDCST
jgi:hypothetical protein